MNLDGALTKKLGPLPVWVYLLGAIAVGWYFWKKRHGGGGSSGGAPGADAPGDVSGDVTSPDSGSFTGTNTMNVNGASASQTAAGALLTGGFVGQPGGYQFAQPAGDVYVNVPTPKQVTNVITGHNPHKDRPPDSAHRRPKHHGDHDDDDDDRRGSRGHKSSHKKKKSGGSHKSGGHSGSHKSSTDQRGNSGGGVNVNLSN